MRGSLIGAGGACQAAVWGFFGVAVVALPSGIIGSGLVDVMEEAKAKRAEEKRLAEQRVQQGKAGGGGDGASRDEMHDPAHFFRLGLKMLLPPVRAADFARLCSLSWFRASRLRPLGLSVGFVAQGTSTTRPSAAEPAPEPEPEPEPEPAAGPPSPTGGGEDGGGAGTVPKNLVINIFRQKGL